MKKNSFNIKVIAIVLAVCLIISYVIYQCVLISKDQMETQIALSETVYSTIDTKCFVVRDEHFIKNNVKGTTVSFAKNGERVASGDTVSIVFDSSDDAVSYLKINEIEKQIAHYEELSGQANFQTMNIDSLTNKIENELIEFLEARDNGQFDTAVANAEIFRDSLTGKQIATGSSLDFSEQLAVLKNELSALQSAKYSFTEVKSDTAGYYINASDGYETVFDYSKLDELTTKDIKNAVSRKPQATSQDTIGRIVDSFTWYIVCVVDTDKTINLSYDKPIYVNFPYQGIEKLPVTLHKIGDREADETVLILSCDLMNEALADLRIEDIQIVTDEFTGYKISNSAIRTVEGEKGVYVVRGNLLGFRKIHIVYSTDDYSIVDNPEGESGYIKLYDTVVTKGVELSDNKLV